MKKPRGLNQKGFVLAGAVAVMLLAAVFLSASTSLVMSSAGTQNNGIQGTQALAIAQAGSEWYMETLRNDTNWTNEINQNRAFGGGNFSIQILSASLTAVRFRSTGTVNSTLAGASFQRFEEWTAVKLPGAFKFALFQGTDPGAILNLTGAAATPTVISGNVWSNGNIRLNAPNNAVNGKVFVPTTRDVTGTGAYVEKAMAAPVPGMPAITTTSYQATLNAFNAAMNVNTSTVNMVVQNTTFNVNGVMRFNTFTTRGNVIIRGSGTIATRGNIQLHGENGIASGSLTVVPTAGGAIEFISDTNVIIGSNNDNPVINIGSFCEFYSRSRTNTAGQLLIRGGRTSIGESNFYAQRRIVVQDGADISGGGLFFIARNATNTNNFIDIIGDNNVTTVQGHLISASTRNPSIRVRNGGAAKNNVQVRGALYAASPGRCQIENARIQGSVVCSQFTGNIINNTAITYEDPSTQRVPPGFETFVSRRDNSWNGY